MHSAPCARPDTTRNGRAMGFCLFNHALPWAPPHARAKYVDLNVLPSSISTCTTAMARSTSSESDANVF